MRHISEYTDYRAYMHDWLEDRRAAILPVSNRWFARKMGVNSSSWLTSLLQGKKNLSKDSANRISSIMKHDQYETRFFETLVFFNQARTIDERNQYYRDLTALKKNRHIRKVVPGQYEFYAEWYHSAIRSIIGMHGFDGDFKGLALMILPRITPAQAKKSVKLLEKLNLIQRDEKGNYTLTSSAITSGEEVRSLAVANFQQETMRLAQEAFDRYKYPERDISTITIGVSEESYGKVRQVLAEARKKIIEIANSDESAERVYQVNIQTFPLSTKDKTVEQQQPEKQDQ